MPDLHEIKTNEDIAELFEKFNFFHDSYINSLSYDGAVTSDCDTITIGDKKAVVKLTFEDIFDIRIFDPGYIFGAYMITGGHAVVFSDEMNYENLSDAEKKTQTYIAARKAYWSIQN